jgi:hypothetical protein
MDAATGKLLNAFDGHLNTAYRCRACFGFNEASVVCGDENGMIWAWDLLDVSSFYFSTKSNSFIWQLGLVCAVTVDCVAAESPS